MSYNQQLKSRDQYSARTWERGQRALPELLLPSQFSDMNDTFNLQRFVQAQNPVFERARSELRAGHKRGHWMWFIFPQIKGLGDSYNSNYFGITSLGEARAYLLHEVLGPRLRECTGMINAVQGRTAGEIFGSPDDMKFRSCMTLFANATTDNQVFQEALKKYYGGKYDPLTLDRL